MDKGLGLRIKTRRNELGMTQAELAKKLGYKTKSSITKIEQGISDITQTQVRQFAEALDCSVSYLMGWSVAGSNETQDAVLKAMMDQVDMDMEKHMYWHDAPSWLKKYQVLFEKIDNLDAEGIRRLNMYTDDLLASHKKEGEA